jgi:hypothetical protein
MKGGVQNHGFVIACTQFPSRRARQGIGMSHRGRERRVFSECPWLSQNSGTGTIQTSACQEPELSLVMSVVVGASRIRRKEG